jgi:hypothetical protein
MSLVLGVMGIPKVEVELLRIIVRLSSNLRAPWTVSDSGNCDVLLVDSATAAEPGTRPRRRWSWCPWCSAARPAPPPRPPAGRWRGRSSRKSWSTCSTRSRRRAHRQDGGRGRRALGPRPPPAPRSSAGRAGHAAEEPRLPAAGRGALPQRAVRREPERAGPRRRRRMLDLPRPAGAGRRAGLVGRSPRGSRRRRPAGGRWPARHRAGLLSRIRRRLGLA